MSLKQHLLLVVGGRTTTMTTAAAAAALPPPSSVEYKIQLQTALRAFQEAAIGIGTASEKLIAYRSYEAHEQQRRQQLSSLQEVRRQLLAEEAFEQRRRAHGSSPASSNSLLRGSGAAKEKSPPEEKWSSKVAEHLRYRRASHGVSRDISMKTSVESTSARRSARSRGSSPQKRSPSAASFAAPQAVVTIDSLTLTPSPSGKLPYTPRDVSLLNSSVFSNRLMTAPVCNPSGAPLPPPAPSPAQRAADDALSITHISEIGTYSTLPDSFVDGAAKETPDDSRELGAAPRQELSVVSIGSSQLEWMTALVDPKPQAAVAKRAPKSVQSIAPLHRGGNADAAPMQEMKGAVNCPANGQHPLTDDQSPSVERMELGVSPASVHQDSQVHAPSSTLKKPAKQKKTTKQKVETAPQEEAVAACNVVNEQNVQHPRSKPAETLNLSISLIKEAEQNEGFYYYCANAAPSMAMMSCFVADETTSQVVHQL